MRRILISMAAATVAVSTALTGAAHASSARVSAVHEEGTSSGQVKQVVDTSALVLAYQGRTLSQAALASLQAAGHARYLAFDLGSAKSGRAHAFETVAELNAYSSRITRRPLSSYTAPAVETPQQRLARLKASGAPASFLAQVAAEASGQRMAHPDTLISGCSGITFGSINYDEPNCRGSQLSMGRTDAVPYFSTYGHNDTFSSVDIQYAGCIVDARFYSNANYSTGSFVWDFLGDTGDYAAYNFNSTQNDRASSEKTTCS